MRNNKIEYNWDVLAITRFYLAMVVLLQHLPATLTHNVVIPWYSQLGSFEAVLGFLMISGMSIGKSIQKQEKGYLQRRIQRIYPIYCSSILLHFFLINDPVSLGVIVTIVINLFFLNQLLIPHSYLVVAWSLSLEVWMYALAPYLYKLKYRTLIKIIFTSFICFVLYTIGRSLLHFPYYAGLGYGLNLVLFSFIWITGFVYSLYPEKRNFIMMITGFFFVSYIGLTITIQLISDFRRHTFEYFFPLQLPPILLQLVLLLVVYLLVFFNHKVVKLKSFPAKFFAFLGNISYPLYLTHHSIFSFLFSKNHRNIFPAIVIALFAACLFYLIFDSYSKKRRTKIIA